MSMGGGGSRTQNYYSSQSIAASNRANELTAQALELQKEQWEYQKRYQKTLAAEAARVTAKEAESRSEFRREGLFGGGSWNEHGKLGGFSRDWQARPGMGGGVKHDAAESVVAVDRSNERAAQNEEDLGPPGTMGTHAFYPNARSKYGKLITKMPIHIQVALGMMAKHYGATDGDYDATIGRLYEGWMNRFSAKTMADMPGSQWDTRSEFRRRGAA